MDKTSASSDCENIKGEFESIFTNLKTLISNLTSTDAHFEHKYDELGKKVVKLQKNNGLFGDSLNHNISRFFSPQLVLIDFIVCSSL